MTSALERYLARCQQNQAKASKGKSERKPQAKPRASQPLLFGAEPAQPVVPAEVPTELIERKTAEDWIWERTGTAADFLATISDRERQALERLWGQQ